MSARHKARKRALDVLFAADLRGVSPLEVLAEELERPHPDAKRWTADDYARALVEGVAADREAIDRVIQETSTNWLLERMPAVDRAILRLGVWELLPGGVVPVAVVVSEAAALAQEYSTEESRFFVQGVLGALVAGDHPLPPRSSR